ncbi:MAG: 3-oxoacyl-ACP synthase [Gammaproteobacteria bacterium]|nr:MAG: 3-oxoacyl-ACP synthase [Gammaproteobacteria bacterium]
MDNVYIKGIGVLGPGLDGWEKAQSALKNGTGPDLSETPPQAVADLLPPNERRRAGAAIRLALHVASEAVNASGLSAEDLPTVFSSCHGDIRIAQKNCLSLTADRPFVSPTLFHNSVHNAPSGYWHIATGSQQPSNSISGGNDSFRAGLLEAAAMLTYAPAALLVCSDPALPAAFQPFDTIMNDFGVALVLAREFGEWGRLDFYADSGRDGPLEPDWLRTAVLRNPAARALPILQAIASGQAESFPDLGVRYQP